MFTGIIQSLGRLEAMDNRGGDVRLRVSLGGLALDNAAIGDSIAVNGVCLTALEVPATELVADVSRETLSLTTLGNLSIGDKVNIEPALAVGDRLGGHIVSGHVDGIGTFIESIEDARSWRLVFEAPAAIAKYIARKGSICIDGISLTVNGVDGNRFDVNIVPHTWEHTNLHALEKGGKVNLEVDVIARYLERMLSAGEAPREGVTAELLQKHGFISDQDK
ncbi:MAG: riboflavin synthase [Gammaproteobacteria bacterium]|nr:riboflavin synthase [Gammaproteobacteria bacterium]